MNNRQYGNIPDELKQLPNWVCWNDRKEPINAKTGGLAKSNNPSTWTDFDTAVEAVDTYNLNGVGIVISPPYVAVDLDTVRNPETGEICTEAQFILDTVVSYTEISQSGTGFHIICIADFTPQKNKKTLPCDTIIERHNYKGELKKNEIEMYSRLHYFALTGNIYDNRTEITEQTGNVKIIHDKYMIDKVYKPTISSTVPPLSISEGDILAIAMRDNVFLPLWHGDITGHQSHSEADLALCNKLAFYCGKDIDMMDRLFRQSTLYRSDKWEREDYRTATLNEAIAGTNAVYDPNYKRNHVTFSKKTDSEDDDIDSTADISALSTWEQISDTDLLMNICMNCSDIDKVDKLSALRDKAKNIQKFKDLNEKIKAVEKECYQIKREQHRQSGNTGIQLDDSPTPPLVAVLPDVGDYTVNHKGVFLYDTCIIPQPLLINKRFEDIEHGTVRLELAFHDKKRWKYITIDKSVTANKNKIVELASQGLLITSETSIGVVKYLQVLQMLNDIPTQSTVSHLGFVDKQFVPYAAGIIYTGTDFEEVYRSVHSKGNLDEWVKLYRDVRNDNIAVRAAVASSFASPLIHVFGKLPFFTHIRGDSDTGKTMTLRVAASVWGYHDGYMLNMNSTNVGAELTAYFLHNLPYILDELQTAKADKVGEFVYKTSQGRGRQRGMANGGVAPVRDWKCCMITNGEQPLTSQNSHTGEINRIIDIPVTGQIFKNPSDVYAVCDEHYGVAGRYFIEHLNEYKPREILDKWETRLNQLNTDISGKHRMALSLILTADELCNRMLFDFDENKAEVDTIEFYQRLSKMIVSTAESDLTTRAYDFICNWLGENYRNFHKTGEQVSPVQYWGRYSEGKTSVLISGNALREALEKNSFNYDAVLKGLADRNLLINNTGNKKNIKQFFINGVRFSGIELTLSTPSTLYLP